MGFFTRLFSRANNPEPSPRSLPVQMEDVEAIVRAYGGVLETHAPPPGCVADASQLPYPKESIEAALLHALRVSDDQAFRARLRVAFLDLSQWQDSVGAVPQGLNLTQFSPEDISKITPDKILEMAPQQERWAPILRADLERLTRKLKETGQWE